MSESILKKDIDELKNSIEHLERSNRELKEALSAGPDAEFREAIGDNIVTLAKKRARLAALEEELRRLTGEDAVAEPIPVPVSDPAPSTSREAAASDASDAAAMDAAGPGTEPQQLGAGDCRDNAGPLDMAVDACGPSTDPGYPEGGTYRGAQSIESYPGAGAMSMDTGCSVGTGGGVGLMYDQSGGCGAVSDMVEGNVEGGVWL